MVLTDGAEPHHLLTPRTTNRVWRLDMMEHRILWHRFTVAALIDGVSRKMLRLKIFARTPATTDDRANLQHEACDSS